MAVFNAQGLPIQLLVQADKNFGNLASMISPGVTLTGRVTEVLADGKAIVNFRGIPVTAEMKGVSLQRGESIQVMVQDLGGTPVFRLLPPAVPTLRSGPAREPAQVPMPGFDPRVSAQLASMGLPRDVFHATIVQLVDAYGLPSTRESVMAVKELALRLPPLLAPAAAPQPATVVPRLSATLPTGQAAPATVSYAGSPAPAPASRPVSPSVFPVAGAPVTYVPSPSTGIAPYPQVSVSLSQGYLLGRVLVQAAALLAQPAAPPGPTAVAPQPAPASGPPVLATPPPPPAPATWEAAPPPNRSAWPVHAGPAPAPLAPAVPPAQVYAALETFRSSTASPVLREIIGRVQQALATTPDRKSVV